MQMWMDLCSTLAVAAAARLGIADVLADAAPQECAALARAVGADATALTRLLRTLVSLGILAQPHPQTYTLTPLGAVLRSDHPGSMRDLLIAVTDPPHVQAWSKLHASVTSGQPVNHCPLKEAAFDNKFCSPIEGSQSLLDWASLGR